MIGSALGSSIVTRVHSCADSNLSQLSGSMRGGSFSQLSNLRSSEHRDSSLLEPGFVDLSPSFPQQGVGGTRLDSLEQEFKLLNVSLPNLSMDEVGCGGVGVSKCNELAHLFVDQKWEICTMKRILVIATLRSCSW